MSEKEVYKWSWEQKRQLLQKMMLNKGGPFAGIRVPKVDEFGGYAKVMGQTYYEIN